MTTTTTTTAINRTVEVGNLYPGDEILTDSDICCIVKDFKFTYENPGAVEIITDGPTLFMKSTDRIFVCSRSV